MLQWRLYPRSYRVYGLTDSPMAASTEILTPPRSSTWTMQTPLPRDVKVKLESGLEMSDVDKPPPQSVISLSSDEEASLVKLVPKIKVDVPPSKLSPPLSQVTVSVVPLLKELATKRGKKNILKKIDYSSIRHKRVEYLPAAFDGPVLFELPLAGKWSSNLQAKSMQGLHKRYHGHMCIKTMTTNITNNFGLSFRYSSCVGWLRCKNKECDFLKFVQKIFEDNKTEFEGCTVQVFLVDQPPPSDSTLVCKVCKKPSSCIATCKAKIYYVAGKGNQTRACIHIGTHHHSIKVGDYKGTKAEITSLIEEHVQMTPQATKSAVVLEASKTLIRSYLLQPEDALPKKLSMEKLDLVFD